ncbi:MAG: hypothetical protein R3E82_23175 [Pseudomonadales bacterium]
MNQSTVSWITTPSITRDGIAIGIFWGLASLLMLFVSRSQMLPDLLIFSGSLVSVVLITFLHTYNSEYTVFRILILYAIAGATWIVAYMAVLTIAFDGWRDGGAMTFMMVAYLGRGVAVLFLFAIAFGVIVRFLRARKRM